MRRTEFACAAHHVFEFVHLRHRLREDQRGEFQRRLHALQVDDFHRGTDAELPLHANAAAKEFDRVPVVEAQHANETVRGGVVESDLTVDERGFEINRCGVGASHLSVRPRPRESPRRLGEDGGKSRARCS